MTQTDRLRAMLDERGVEWTFSDGTVHFDDGEHWFLAWAYNDGGMCVSMGYLTPEQAIAATLGAGTCKNLANHQGCTEFVCSECGTHYLGFRFKYCPGCGAKVVDE